MSLYSGQGRDWGYMYGEIQCIMGNGHMGTPLACEKNDRYTKYNMLYLYSSQMTENYNVPK